MIESHITSKGFALVLQGLEKLPESVLQAGAKGLGRGLKFAADISEREFLQGPRPEKLGEVSTHLRHSITTEVTANGESVTGVMGTNVSYGAYHEFGFVGTQHVKAFERTVSRLKATGAKIEKGILRDHKGQFLAVIHKKSTQVKSTQQVKAHDRKVNYKGRPFVRPAIERAMPMILEEINKEMGNIKLGA